MLHAMQLAWDLQTWDNCNWYRYDTTSIWWALYAANVMPIVLYYELFNITNNYITPCRMGLMTFAYDLIHISRKLKTHTHTHKSGGEWE